MTHIGPEKHMRDREEGFCCMVMSIWVPLETVCELRMLFMWEAIISRSLVEKESRKIIQGRGQLLALCIPKSMTKNKEEFQEFIT